MPRRSTGGRTGAWRRAGAITLAMFGLLLAMAGCAGPDHREHHPDQEGAGPLSATSGTGGFFMARPDGVRDSTWHGSFGSYLLCSRTGETITLQKVTYEAEVEPVSLTPYLRVVSPADDQRDDDGTLTRGTSSVGRPPHLRSDEQNVGRFMTDIDGHEITQPCEELDRAGVGYTDLVLTVETDRGGAYIPHSSVHYEAGGREYALDIRWEMATCGTDIPRVDGEQKCAPID